VLIHVVDEVVVQTENGQRQTGEAVGPKRLDTVVVELQSAEIRQTGESFRGEMVDVVE